MEFADVVPWRQLSLEPNNIQGHLIWSVAVNVAEGLKPGNLYGDGEWRCDERSVLGMNVSSLYLSLSYRIMNNAPLPILELFVRVGRVAGTRTALGLGAEG